MNRIPALFPAVVGVTALVLAACSAPADSAAPSPSASPSFPRVVAVMPSPYTDIPTLQADREGRWTVRTAPTEGDRVAVRAAVDTDADGFNDPYGDRAAVASRSALDARHLTLVLSPDGSAVWAVTAEQAAAHPDLEPVTALIQ